VIPRRLRRYTPATCWDPIVKNRAAAPRCRVSELEAGSRRDESDDRSGRQAGRGGARGSGRHQPVHELVQRRLYPRITSITSSR
jgi:hypothetical protein